MRVATPYKRPTSAIPYISSGNSLSSAEVVILDDSKSLVEAISAFLQSNDIKRVDTYCSPSDLLKNLSKYSVDTKIFMDNDFKSDISGEDLARELAAQGYKNIYILRTRIHGFRNGV